MPIVFAIYFTLVIIMGCVIPKKYIMVFILTNLFPYAVYSSMQLNGNLTIASLGMDYAVIVGTLYSYWLLYQELVKENGDA